MQTVGLAPDRRAKISREDESAFVPRQSGERFLPIGLADLEVQIERVNRARKPERERINYASAFFCWDTSKHDVFRADVRRRFARCRTHAASKNQRPVMTLAVGDAQLPALAPDRLCLALRHNLPESADLIAEPNFPVDGVLNLALSIALMVDVCDGADFRILALGKACERVLYALQRIAVSRIHELPDLIVDRLILAHCDHESEVFSVSNRPYDPGRLIVGVCRQVDVLHSRSDTAATKRRTREAGTGPRLCIEGPQGEVLTAVRSHDISTLIATDPEMYCCTQNIQLMEFVRSMISPREVFRS